MNEQDEFAVWLAETMLRANGDGFGAAALVDIRESLGPRMTLNQALDKASTHTQRPGDFGVEFVGPLLPVLLVEFGRLLWNAYAKALVEESGKALAKATIDRVKDMVRHTFTKAEGAAIKPADAEAVLRQAGQTAGLNLEQIDKLVETLHSVQTVRALAES
jgi:hypothetical protein